ncbi:MAG: AAA family ATPase [Verrucomicrobiia bacterium]
MSDQPVPADVKSAAPGDSAPETGSAAPASSEPGAKGEAGPKSGEVAPAPEVKEGSASPAGTQPSAEPSRAAEAKETAQKDVPSEKVQEKDPGAVVVKLPEAELLTEAQQKLLAGLQGRYEGLQKELEQAIVGQREVVESILMTVFCGGHALITGVPGLAKTLMIRSLAKALDVSFSRIQFTPDLMPSDITGTDILEEDPVTGKRKVEFLRGPVFANLVLADEINRTPPKTQAALLQTMQEHQVTVGVKTYDLPEPFHVFATQNPIDQEGTYVLPEAQADRFMFSITCGYPSPEEEEAIVRCTTGNRAPELKPVLTGGEILEIQKIVRAMPVSDEVVRYAVKLVGATRPERADAPKLIRDFVRFGAGPRASQFLVLGAKARAALTGKACAEIEGVRFVAKRVLSHRLILNFSARASRVSVDTVLDEILKQVKG